MKIKLKGIFQISFQQTSINNLFYGLNLYCIIKDEYKYICVLKSYLRLISNDSFLKNAWGVTQFFSLLVFNLLV